MRPAVAADGDAIGEVEVATWRLAYAGLLPEETIAAFDVEPRKQMRRDGLARGHKPGTAIFAAEDEGKVVGSAWVGGCRDEAGSAELYAIYLNSAHWGTGVGRALLERAGFQDGRRIAEFAGISAPHGLAFAMSNRHRSDVDGA